MEGKMTIALFVALVGTLAQSTAPVVPGFGRPWFETARPQPRPTFSASAGVGQTAPMSVPSCVMRTIVAPKNLDPKIVVEPPKNVRHSMRIIEPSCR
jgi:hypothetical protein